MSPPTASLSLPFGEGRLIAHSSRAVLVRSPRDNGGAQHWRVNGVDYVGDVRLVRDGTDSRWRTTDWSSLYLHRPGFDREPTPGAREKVREAVVSAVTWWAGTPEGRRLLAAADAADCEDAAEALRGKARDLCERAAELRALAKRVAAGDVPPDEGRKTLSETRRY